MVFEQLMDGWIYSLTDCFYSGPHLKLLETGVLLAAKIERQGTKASKKSLFYKGAIKLAGSGS